MLEERGVKAPRPQLLRQALTHRSAGKENYERLEFLGDALVNCLCAELLFEMLPHASEGELTRIRANLVDETSLAAFARELCLSDALTMGGGELKSGGYRRESILADAFEALTAAIYLDHGGAEMKSFVEPFLRAALTVAQLKASQKDPKTQLQEWVQDRGRALPVYSLIESTGLDHNRQFFVSCTIAATEKYQPAQSSGRGSSLKRAEQDAALAMLTRLLPKLANNPNSQGNDS